jgi:hypothetical protein
VSHTTTALSIVESVCTEEEEELSLERPKRKQREEEGQNEVELPVEEDALQKAATLQLPPSNFVDTPLWITNEAFISNGSECLEGQPQVEELSALCQELEELTCNLGPMEHFELSDIDNVEFSQLHDVSSDSVYESMSNSCED